MSQKLRIIVTGQLVQYPLGGVTWFYLQYALGLLLLGHDTFYFEDTGQWPYHPGDQGLRKDCTFNINYAKGVLDRFGFSERWAYRPPWQTEWLGLSESRRKEVLETADLLINVSGTLERPQLYRQVPRLAYVDTDPVFTQVKLARGQKDFQKLVSSHDVQFSYAESPHSKMPETQYRWRPTRAPVVLREWRPEAPHRDVFTTVMNWTSHNSVEFQGQTYGQKDVEFKRFLDLPKRVQPATLELAIGPGHGQRTPYDLLRYKGWQLVDPDDVCPDLERFRTYTESSKAEWGVAKNGYVVGQSGWFSERSARYLAAGRPVVVQDAGFSAVLPTGEGIVPFHNMEEAVAGIQDVEARYDRHAKAARAIAEEYFDSGKVLSKLVEEAMNGV
jgi:hypothetical protein